MFIQKVQKKALYHEQVYDILKNNILAGNLKLGEKINENTISKEFGVSRSPVREARRMLQQDEILVTSDSGIIVNPLTTDLMQDVYECRIILEPHAARLSVSNITDEEIQNLMDIIEQSKRAHEEDCADTIVEMNTKFHDLIIEPCTNERLKNIIERNRYLLYMARRQEFYRYKKDEKYLEEHIKIVEMFKIRDADKVEECMKNHLRNDLKFYLDMN